ncbi:MAG: hypothetical protein JWM98_1909, partial [Thermoleophilia bacterium]|nr:hypothetical protein [Thermoleophilia bacterium]
MTRRRAKIRPATVSAALLCAVG